MTRCRALVADVGASHDDDVPLADTSQASKLQASTASSIGDRGSPAPRRGSHLLLPTSSRLASVRLEYHTPSVIRSRAYRRRIEDRI